jgi:hypothetical protein
MKIYKVNICRYHTFGSSRVHEALTKSYVSMYDCTRLSHLHRRANLMQTPYIYGGGTNKMETPESGWANALKSVIM